MTKGKVISVHKDAHGLVKALKDYDPAPPSKSDMKQTSGVDNEWVQDYHKGLADFGAYMRQEFADRLELLQKDLDESLAAIKDMQGLDEEIARLIKGLKSDVPKGKSSKGRS